MISCVCFGKIVGYFCTTVGRTVVVYWHFPFLQPWSVSATSGPGAKPRWPPTKGHSLCPAPPRPLVNHFGAISPSQQAKKGKTKKNNWQTQSQPRDTPYALHPQDPWSIIFGLFLLYNRQTKKTTKKQNNWQTLSQDSLHFLGNLFGVTCF